MTQTPRDPHDSREGADPGETPNWAQEFQAFASAPRVAPPRATERRLTGRIHAFLNPPAWLVFAKLSAIHLLTGAATLLICPQMGVSFLGDEALGLMGVFMAFGIYGCMVGCGGFFLGATALVASMALRPEELRAVRQHELWHVTALSAVSLLVLVVLGAEAGMRLWAVWLLGSILGGIATLELGWKLRFNPSHGRS